MGLLYTFSIFLFQLGIKIAALFNPKAKQAIEGRKRLFKKLEKDFQQPAQTIWIHCASLGEFEQARPLIEMIKSQKADKKILLTFFSPSGYNAQKNYELADVVSYLPMDFPKNARRFLEIVQPDAAIFVKYEFWFNFLKALRKRKIPSYLVSGIFWPHQHFFKYYGQWFAGQLSVYKHFFVQNNLSASLLQAIGYKNVTISGDSRFDRVIKLSKETFTSNRLRSFCAKHKAIIFGSSWSKEEKMAAAAAKQFPTEKIIIAPHEIKAGNIQELKASFSNAILWSETSEQTDLSTYQVLIIDQIGLLSKVYRFGKIAIIGGGFGAGIHNTLEAAVYGCPLLFGPNYQRFQEAHDLIACGAAKVIHDEAGFLEQLNLWIADEEKRTQASEAAKVYVKKNAGATRTIFDTIFNS